MLIIINLFEFSLFSSGLFSIIRLSIQVFWCIMSGLQLWYVFKISSSFSFCYLLMLLFNGRGICEKGIKSCDIPMVFILELMSQIQKINLFCQIKKHLKSRKFNDPISLIFDIKIYLWKPLDSKRNKKRHECM